MEFGVAGLEDLVRAHHSPQETDEPITDSVMQVNQKGQPLKEVLSHHHWITTTNSEMPMPTDETDRRAAWIRGDDSKKKDNQYFTALYALLEDRDALHTIWAFFRNRQVKKLLTARDLPK
eukprot:Hpha_TRINITY_DN35854_c0_g1::TRINITY_DN35854_c0_g1_i1::g.84993::m.84993